MSVPVFRNAHLRWRNLSVSNVTAQARAAALEGHRGGQIKFFKVDFAPAGVIAILGSTFDGSYEPVEAICKKLDELQEDGGPNIPVHVDGASGAMIAPFLDPELVWGAHYVFLPVYTHSAARVLSSLHSFKCNFVVILAQA